MTEEDFFSGVSNPRNKVLMRVFKDVELVEQLGSGLIRILNTYDKSIFKITDNYIRIVFKFKRDLEVGDDRSGAKAAQRRRICDANESKIIKFLNEYGRINSKEAADELKLSKSQANRVLRKMVENNIIEKVGKSVSTYYIIK